ncbi:MAG: GGDEF domain-containing protein [Sphaerochaeta sp.]|nr:GGDEF domain-containing protein [Sphaerochaeta sp.]
MPSMYYVQNSIIGMILVGIMLYYVLGQGGKRQPLDSLFVLLLLSTMALLSLEMFRHLFQGMTFGGAKALHTASVLLFFLCNPLLGYFYFLYIDQMQNRWWSIPLRMGVLGTLPLVLSSLFSIASLFNGMVFFIDAANLYFRGPYFFLVPFTNFIYLLGGQAHNLMHMKRQGIRKVQLYNILFPIPLITASILQAHNEQLVVLYISVAFTLLMTFLHIQNTHASRDYLTALYNRSVGEQSLAFLFQRKEEHSYIGGILMDIDGFKEVNDRYGHDFGDRVLRYVSQILSEGFSRDWLICRYGGDEFFLFRKMDDPDLLEDAIVRFKKKLDQFNSSGKLPFALSVSMGRGLDEPGSECGHARFLKLLDEGMYLIKKVHYQEVGQSPVTLDHC